MIRGQKTVSVRPKQSGSSIGLKQVAGLVLAAVGVLLTVASDRIVGAGFIAIWIGLGLTLSGGMVRRWGGAFITATILLVVAMGITGKSATGNKPLPRSAPAAQTTPAATPAPAPPRVEEPVLELLSSRGYEEHTFHHVSGEVKNVSDRSLESVMVVVTWYTDADQLVKTDEALIDFNPILPGQTSPFESLTSSNPAMSKYSISFKRIFGATLKTKDSRKK